MKALFLGVLCVAGTLATGALAGKNLIKDGSFETPLAPDGGLTRYTAGNAVGPWLVIGDSGSVDVFGKGFTYAGFDIVARKGNQQLDLTGASDSAMGIQQTIKTAPEATYTLTLSIGTVYGPDQGLGVASTVNILVDGAALTSFTNKAKKNGPAVQQWRKFSTQFVASGDKTTIAFMNGDPHDDTDNAIDAISVVRAD